MTMRPLAVFGGIAAGVLICLGAFGVAAAQDQPQGDDTQMIEQLGEGSDETTNPPGRAAQLSDAEGSVSLQPAGTSTWTSAVLNRPLTLGDKLWTDQNSRAELDIGDAVIRLGSTTGFSFLNLDDQTAQMQVTAGTVIVHVRSLSSGEQDEIDTPNLALTLEQPGTYRVEVSDSGDTTIVKVDSGAALATGGGQSYPVAEQQSVTFTGTAALTADYASLGSPDALDDWSMQRDQQQSQQAAVSQEYVSPDTVGADDLSAYGGWESTPDWGYAWFPAVSVGWAPYTVGHWVWVSPWGWTWVDEEPWGFAPFHYGRWGYWHRRWCWIPGPRRKRPVYAPALVAWVGGSRAGVSVSAGARIGWLPLGPRDVYVPGHHASAAYVRNVNLANTRLNTTEIGNVYGGHVARVRYANSEVPGAVTAVPRNVFISAQRVGPHRVNLPQQSMAGLRPTSVAPAIVPARESVFGVSAGRPARAPPRALIDRPVVARLAPPRAPVSFTSEQAAIRANGGRPLPMTELSRMRPNRPAASVRLVSPAQNRRVPTGPGMSARESALQHPSLPPANALRGDRPPWVRGARPETSAPQQRQPQLEWRSPPQRQVVPDRQAPVQRFAPQPQVPQRQAQPQRFAPPPQERQAPPQRFAPPPQERQAPPQRFAPPPQERQAPPQRFAPPPVERAPPQRFAPPPVERAPPQRFAPPPPREAPARPDRAPEGRPRSPPRADAAPVAVGTGYALQWQSPPPMYRPQESTIRYATPAPSGEPAATPYQPPASPPPMYRPIPSGSAAARAVSRSSGHLALGRTRSLG